MIETRFVTMPDGTKDYFHEVQRRLGETYTQTEYDNCVIEIENEIENETYILDRINEYPSIEEQLDMQYWDAINGTTIWQDTINAIKAKYPKPE